MHDELDGRRARKRDTIFSAGQSIGHLQRMEAFHPRRPPSSIPSCRTLVLVGRGTQAPNGADSLGTPAFLARSQRWFGNQIPCPSQLLSPPAPSPIDGCNSPAPRSSVRCFELVFLPSPLHARQRCICIGPQDTATGRRISWEESQIPPTAGSKHCQTELRWYFQNHGPGRWARIHGKWFRGGGEASRRFYICPPVRPEPRIFVVACRYYLPPC